MEVLAKPNIESTPEKTQQEEKELSELEYARNLYNLERFSEAFFIARRLAAEGDNEAKRLAERIREAIESV